MFSMYYFILAWKKQPAVLLSWFIGQARINDLVFYFFISSICERSNHFMGISLMHLEHLFNLFDFIFYVTPKKRY